MVFKHKSEWFSTNFLLQGQPLRQVSDCAYLGVVLMDNLACTSDREHSKRTFFKEHNSVDQKFSYVDTNVLLYLLTIHAMSFFGIETWVMKLHKKNLNYLSVVYHKAVKRIYGRNSYDSNLNVLNQLVYQFLTIFLLENLFVTHIDNSRQKAHV